jgi:enolase
MIGKVSETLKTVETVKTEGFLCLSHRSGETEDFFLRTSPLQTNT